MALQPLRIIKRWFTNNAVSELDWDEIANKVSAYAERTNNNLKQIGLDIDGDTYDFNNVGRATQTSSVVSRLNAIESAQTRVGSQNMALDVSSTDTVKVVSANGTDLAVDNVGQFTTPSTTSAGLLSTVNVTSNISVTLTGAHWGLGTLGDFTDVPLWILLINTGSGAVLGVSRQGGRTSIAPADISTVPTTITSREKVLVDTSFASESNVVELGWIKGNFDDTGNPGGEDYWTIQTGPGDINFGKNIAIMEGTIFEGRLEF